MRINTEIKVTANITNLGGTQVDPTSFIWYVVAPDGEVEVVDSNDARYGHPSTGQFTLIVTLDKPGVWIINGQSTNPTASETTKVYVLDRYQ